MPTSDSLPQDPNSREAVRFGLDTLGDDRRQSMRFPREPGTDFAAVLHPAECEGRVEVANESLGGLGVVVDDPHLYEVGMTMELVYAGGYLNATVCHVTPTSDGRFLIGLKCN